MGAWLAQSVEHVTPDLRVMSSSPTLDVEPTLKKKKKGVQYPPYTRPGRGWALV